MRFLPAIIPLRATYWRKQTPREEISRAAPDSEERKLIEHCKNYIVACGVLRGIQYENIASMQDAIKKIADAYQVDLTVGRAVNAPTEEQEKKETTAAEGNDMTFADPFDSAKEMDPNEEKEAEKEAEENQTDKKEKLACKLNS